jgi:hypothetical protein
MLGWDVDQLGFFGQLASHHVDDLSEKLGVEIGALGAPDAGLTVGHVVTPD